MNERECREVATVDALDAVRDSWLRAVFEFTGAEDYEVDSALDRQWCVLRYSARECVLLVRLPVAAIALPTIH